MDVHEDLEQLAFLLGTWRGEGRGEYSTIDAFSYAEEVTFEHIGKPFLSYHQRTWHPEKKFRMHGEMGYWRSVGPGRVELVIVQPTGVVEVSEGTVAGGVVDVRSRFVAHSSTAKEVTEIARRFELADGVLQYELSMAAVGRPLAGHLRARLQRVDA